MEDFSLDLIVMVETVFEPEIKLGIWLVND